MVFFINFFRFICKKCKKFNNLKLKKSLFTLNLFLKKDLKKSFKFFFKNIIMFLYKFSVIKHKKRKFFTLFTNKTKKIYKKYHLAFRNRKKQLRAFKKTKRNIQFERKRIMLYKKRKYELYKKFMTTKNLRIKIEKEINSLQQITNELIKKNKKSRLIKENNQQLKLINNKRKKLQL